MEIISFLLMFGQCLIAFLVTFSLVPVAQWIAPKIKFIDLPDGNLKNQSRAVPYLGGVCVYIGFVSGLLMGVHHSPTVILFVCGMTLLLLVGLLDDYKPLLPYEKWLGQLIAVACLIKSGFYFKEHFLSSPYLIIISAFWLLTLINALNFVDVMDGLATTITLTSSIAFLYAAYSSSCTEAANIICPLMGSLTAFLWYNWPSASIYLGDAGSLFLGGFLATLPFFIKWGERTEYGFLTPIVILAVPLLEITLLIIIRTYKQIPFYRGSPHHFCHYLLAQGWSKQAILYYIGAVSLVNGSISLLFMQGIISVQTLLFLGFIFFIWWLVIIFLPIKKKI